MKRTLLFLFVLLGMACWPTSARPVRIGVFGLFHTKVLVLRPERGAILNLETGAESHLLTNGSAAELRLVRGSVECRVGDRLLKAFVIRVTAAGADETSWSLAVPGKIERVFSGALEVRATREELVPVLILDRETAVSAVVVAESPPGAGLEALKAQAIVARSYYAAARRRHSGFDFCDTTHCQFMREVPPPGSSAARATAETRGLVLAYRDAVVSALYSASCGGRTHSLAEAKMTPENYPYLPVVCQPCLQGAERWEKRFSSNQITSFLASGRSERDRLAIGRKLGWSAVPGTNFSVERDGDIVILRGRGAGHGVGLCQLGAAAMARQGADFRKILRHYFPNTTLKESDDE